MELRFHGATSILIQQIMQEIRGMKMALYVITDGNKNYIRRDPNGKYVSAKNRALADEFPEKYKAEKVLKNNLTPKKRKLYRVVEEEAGFSILNELSRDHQTEQSIKNTSELSQIDELRNNIAYIKSFLDNTENRKSELSDLLSNIDKEISDIHHYIELSENEDFTSIYDMLKKRLRSRRQIKNEFSILKQLGECKIDTSMLENILLEIDDLNNKTYVPRVLSNLFT